ncbi:MAG: acyl-ACP--UDP-N-acetylglucosamine O-acyltransferase [Pseudomonadota bacterium]
MLGRFDGRTKKGRVVIHDSAIIDPSAQIGDGCEIGPFCVIGANVTLGAGSKLRSHVVIDGPCAIGSGNTFFQFSSIGEQPQDLKYNGEPTRLEIGDNNVFREYVTLHRGTGEGGGLTKIGSNNLLMAYTHVAHDCVLGDGIIMSNAASIAGHVVIGDQVILGGFTCVHQFTQIGAHSFSGLGTVINRDVPPFTSIAGNHARAIGINKKGLQRRGFSDESIAALHKSFRILIKSRRPRQESLDMVAPLREQFSEVEEFVSFILNSERSVVR